MITVVKIGGNVVDNPQELSTFLKDFAAFPGSKILVHGGGKEATRLSAALGIETKMIDGRRVTDRATLDVVTMVYSGLVSKRIVSQLQALGVNAIGLSGADGNTIQAVKRNPEPVDFGFVGDINPQQVNTQMISAVLDSGLTPIFSAIMHDGRGSLLNCNADGVASAIAMAMKAQLVYCFEKDGVLADVNDETTLVPLITPANYSTLRATKAVSGGMIPKIDNALKAIENGASSVVIKNSKRLLQDNGTTIRLA